MTRIAAIAAALVLIVGGVAYTTLSSPDPEAALPSLGMAGAQTTEADADDASPDAIAPEDVPEYVLGDPDAPVTLVEYASFTCPHCATFHLGPLKQLKENYIDTGKVNLLYREVYFDRFGLWAAMLARCGGEDRYFGIVDLIYQQQSEWTRGDDAAEIADNLRTIGRTAGLSNDELDACLTDETLAQAMIARYQQNVERDGIEATPSFVIGDTTYRNMSYDELAKLLDAELEE
jgi:protein-disulfide isomerase